VQGSYDDLKIGSEVRFVEEMGRKRTRRPAPSTWKASTMCRTASPDTDKEAMIPAEAERQWQGLRQKVAFLKQASSYPEKTGPVVAVETHMSWYF